MKFLRLTISMARSMHGHAYHHYVSKYEILGKYLQPFTRYSTKEKPEVPKCQMLAANILNLCLTVYSVMHKRLGRLSFSLFSLPPYSRYCRLRGWPVWAHVAHYQPIVDAVASEGGLFGPM